MVLCSVYPNPANRANGASFQICDEADRTRQLVPILQSFQSQAQFLSNFILVVTLRSLMPPSSFTSSQHGQTNASIWVVSTPVGTIFSMFTQGSLWGQAILPVLQADMVPLSSACCAPNATSIRADRITTRGGALTSGALRSIRISGKGGF